MVPVQEHSAANTDTQVPTGCRLWAWAQRMAKMLGSPARVCTQGKELLQACTFHSIKLSRGLASKCSTAIQLYQLPETSLPPPAIFHSTLQRRTVPRAQIGAAGTHISSSP